MANKELQRFYMALELDENMRSKLRSRIAEQIDSEALVEVASFAKERGFNLSGDFVKEGELNMTRALAAANLNDDELGGITGGGGTASFITATPSCQCPPPDLAASLGIPNPGCEVCRR
jgi:hypothetical protein